VKEYLVHFVGVVKEETDGRNSPWRIRGCYPSLASWMVKMAWGVKIMGNGMKMRSLIFRTMN
jgi:hypothetical protein